MWSKALPLTANCLSSMPGACEKVVSDRVRRWFSLDSPISFSNFLLHLQMASHDLEAVWQAEKSRAVRYYLAGNPNLPFSCPSLVYLADIMVSINQM